jgi:hypothetical protein
LDNFEKKHAPNGELWLLWPQFTVLMIHYPRMIRLNQVQQCRKHSLSSKTWKAFKARKKEWNGWTKWWIVAAFIARAIKMNLFQIKKLLEGLKSEKLAKSCS